MSITRNSVLAFLPQAVGIVVGIATSIITARTLGPSGRGVLSLAIVMAGILVLVSDFGVGAAITYFTSKRTVDESRGLAVCTYSALVLGAVIITLAGLLWPVISDTVLRGLSLNEYLIAIAAVPFILFAQHWTRMRMALDRFASAMSYQISLSIGTLAIAVVVLIALDGGVFAYIGAITGLNAIIALALFGASYSTAGFKARIPLDVIRDFLSYGARSYLGGLVNYATLRVDALILNAFSTNAAVGYYTMGVTLAEKAWLVDQSVGQATMPQVVARDREGAARVVAVTNRNILLVVGTIALALAVLAEPIIRLLYGVEYLPAVMPLRLLAPGIVTYSSARILLQYHQGQLGRPGVSSMVMTGAAFVSVALYLLLIPRWGMNGAAIASSVTYTLIFLVALTLFVRASGMSPRETLIPRAEDFKRYASWTRRILRGPAG